MKYNFNKSGIIVALLSVVLAAGILSSGNSDRVLAGANTAKSANTTLSNAKKSINNFAVAVTLHIPADNMKVLETIKEDFDTFLKEEIETFKTAIYEYQNNIRASLSNQARENEEKSLQIWNRDIETLNMWMRTLIPNVKKEYLLLKRRLLLAKSDEILQEINNSNQQKGLDPINGIMEAPSMAFANDDDLADLCLSSGALIGYSKDVVDITEIFLKHVKDFVALELLAKKNRDKESQQAKEDHEQKLLKEIEGSMGVEKSRLESIKRRDNFIHKTNDRIRDSFAFII